MAEYNHDGLEVSIFDDEMPIDIIRSTASENISYIAVIVRPDDGEPQDGDVSFTAAIRNRFGEEFFVDGDEGSVNIYLGDLPEEDSSITLTDDEFVLIATLRARVAALVED